MAWIRDRGGRLVRPTASAVVEPMDVVDGEVVHSANVMTEDGVVPQGYGPANFVDPVTYRRIRADARRSLRKRKRSSGRRKSRRRSSYRRRRPYGRGGSRSMNAGMGPIVITGRGGYWSDKFKAGAGALYRGLSRSIPEGTFSRLGGAVGGAMFGGTGNAVGQYAGKQIAGLAGFGAYSVNSNSLMLPEGSPVPTFANMSQATVVCHREYIKDIQGPASGAAFSLDSFPINPGNPKTFPWLSQIAQNYDQYALLGVVFEFKSTASDSLNTGVLGLGTVILATDYDSADALYSSKIEMENSQFSITTKPNEDCLHPIECDPSVGFNEIKYLRGISVPVGKDQRLYDHGTFQIATQGLPNNAGAIGELWVTYQIALYKPQFLVQGQGSITDMFTLSAGLVDATKFTLGGVVQQADLGSSIGGSIQTNTYTFPAYIQSGKYLVQYVAFGANTTLANNIQWTGLVNCVATNIYGNDALNTFQPYTGGLTYTAASSNICITVTGSVASFAVTTAAGLPTSVTVGNLFVMSIDKNA